jgi:hypothetical protein
MQDEIELTTYDQEAQSGISDPPNLFLTPREPHSICNSRRMKAANSLLGANCKTGPRKCKTNKSRILRSGTIGYSFWYKPWRLLITGRVMEPEHLCGRQEEWSGTASGHSERGEQASDRSRPNYEINDQSPGRKTKVENHPFTFKFGQICSRSFLGLR